MDSGDAASAGLFSKRNIILFSIGALVLVLGTVGVVFALRPQPGVKPAVGGVANRATAVKPNKAPIVKTENKFVQVLEPIVPAALFQWIVRNQTIALATLVVLALVIIVAIVATVYFLNSCDNPDVIPDEEEIVLEEEKEKPFNWLLWGGIALASLVTIVVVIVLTVLFRKGIIKLPVVGGKKTADLGAGVGNAGGNNNAATGGNVGNNQAKQQPNQQPNQQLDQQPNQQNPQQPQPNQQQQQQQQPNQHQQNQVEIVENEEVDLQLPNQAKINQPQQPQPQPQAQQQQPQPQPQQQPNVNPPPPPPNIEDMHKQLEKQKKEQEEKRLQKQKEKEEADRKKAAEEAKKPAGKFFTKQPLNKPNQPQDNDKDTPATGGGQNTVGKPMIRIQELQEQLQLNKVINKN